jgi:hypothetical protein
LKQALGQSSAANLIDIYDEKTGESKAKVPALIIACFEGDYDTIKFLLDVRKEFRLERKRLKSFL